MICHARTTVPATQTFVIDDPDRKAARPYRYRATSTSRRSPAAAARSPTSTSTIGRRYSYRRPRTQLRLGPLPRRHLPHPRPLHLRRRHDHRRQRRKALRCHGPLSRPPRPSYTCRPGPLAQLVEQETLNLKVDGSSPSRPTFPRTAIRPAGCSNPGGWPKVLWRVPCHEFFLLFRFPFSAPERFPAFAEFGHLLLHFLGFFLGRGFRRRFGGRLVARREVRWRSTRRSASVVSELTVGLGFGGDPLRIGRVFDQFLTFFSPPVGGSARTK